MSHKRPRGIWKARTAEPRVHLQQDSDTDDDGAASRSSGSSKRRRSSYSQSTRTEYEDSPRRERSPRQQCFCGLEQWDELKELFAQAADRYDNDSVAEAIPLLRSVILECNRFLRIHHDPSVLFVEPIRRPYTKSLDLLTPIADRLTRDWDFDHESRPSLSRPSSSQSRRRADRTRELPTAFHAIFGITLYLFGNLIAQDPSLALEGEPKNGATYWLAALDVFETGESLPSKTDGFSPLGEDWRMAIAWGRTLVCLADEKASGTNIVSSEPQWPKDSPFAAIAKERPPITRRMTLSMSTAHDIMVLAMDQFSRGIFHMPHPARPPSDLLPEGFRSETFSRPKELFTIASDVLGVAEKLTAPSERRYWAQWADGVFNQMKMESDMDQWRTSITSARGRCWLIAGSAHVEDLEMSLEAGDSSVLDSEEADEAREGLAKAIEFFEHAKGSIEISSLTDPPSLELHSLLAESILTLANLTKDENTREQLYTRAQVEAGDQIQLDSSDDRMDQC